MTRTCFLHLGMPKTGSTTIQHSLATLQQPDLRYAQLLGSFNHGLCIRLAFCRDLERIKLSLRRKRHTTAQLEAKQAIARSALQAEFARPESLVLSGEMLTALMSAEEVEDFRTELMRHFDQVRIIVYLRDFHSVAPSRFQQEVKLGRGEFKIVPLHFLRLSPWLRAFGRQSFDFVHFERQSLFGQDILQDFAHRIDADMTAMNRTDRNESLSLEAVALLFLKNQRPDRMVKTPDCGWKDLNIAVRGFGSRKFSFGQKVLDRALAHDTADIVWMQDLTGFDLIGKPSSNPFAVESKDHLLQIAQDAMPEFNAYYAQNRTEIDNRIAHSRKARAAQPKSGSAVRKALQAIRRLYSRRAR